RVERAKRFIHQNDRRIVDQRPDQGGTLAHAARELVRIMVFEAAEADGADQHLGARAGLRVQSALHGKRKQHVRQRGPPRQQMSVLRQITDAAGEARLQRLGIVDRSTLRLEAHLAAACHIDLRDDVEERGLAGARGTDDGEEFTFAYRKREILDDPGRQLAPGALGKALGEAADLQQRFLHDQVPACKVTSDTGRQRSSRRSTTFTLQLPMNTTQVVATSATKIPVVPEYVAPSWIR